MIPPGSIHAHDAQCNGSENRRYARYDVHIDAILRASGAPLQHVRLNNLSAAGLGLVGAVGLAPGQAVTVELQSGRQLNGTIVWQLSGCAGLQFSSALAEDDVLLLAAASGPSQENGLASRSF